MDFPGGGIHQGETPENALLRELREELGSSNFEIIKKSENFNKYEWPEEIILRKLKEKGHTWRGQIRNQFLVKFTGNDNEITIPLEEIKKYKWVSVAELGRCLIFPNQWENAKKLLKEFLLIN